VRNDVRCDVPCRAVLPCAIPLLGLVTVTERVEKRPPSKMHDRSRGAKRRETEDLQRLTVFFFFLCVCEEAPTSPFPRPLSREFQGARKADEPVAGRPSLRFKSLPRGYDCRHALVPLPITLTRVFGGLVPSAARVYDRICFRLCPPSAFSCDDRRCVPIRSEKDLGLPGVVVYTEIMSRPYRDLIDEQNCVDGKYGPVITLHSICVRQ
jgi:hypothetical protein